MSERDNPADRVVSEPDEITRATTERSTTIEGPVSARPMANARPRSGGTSARPSAGKKPLVQARYGAPTSSAVPAHAESVTEVAQAGVRGGAAKLPHLDQVQRAFGGHDLQGVRAHVGGSAATASEAIGAEAYTTDNEVAFRGPPDLHTAAHEAAHVVQQREGVQLKGGVGEVGDRYEQQADRVADAVVQGKSAESILGPTSGSTLTGGVVQKQESLEDEQKEGLLEATGLLYQDILEKQAIAINTVYQAQKKAPKPTWDEALLKFAVTKMLDLALLPLGLVGEGPGGKVISAAADAMKGALEKKLHAEVERRVGPALPDKNPALAFFIPLHDSLVDAKHTAQQSFMTLAKPALKATGDLAVAQSIHQSVTAQYEDVCANFEKQVTDRWMLYLAGARYGVDKSGDTDMGKTTSDMEGGAFGHGPTGTLFLRVAFDGDLGELVDPKLKVVSFDIFGLGADMWELVTKQNRTVKEFKTDVKIFGPAGDYEFWVGDSSRKLPEQNAYFRIARNPSGAVWDLSDERGTAWLELVGYGQAGRVSEAYRGGGFKVDQAKRMAGVRKIFDSLGDTPVDREHLIKR